MELEEYTRQFDGTGRANGAGIYIENIHDEADKVQEDEESPSQKFINPGESSCDICDKVMLKKSVRKHKQIVHHLFEDNIDSSMTEDSRQSEAAADDVMETVEEVTKEKVQNVPEELLVITPSQRNADKGTPKGGANKNVNCEVCNKSSSDCSDSSGDSLRHSPCCTSSPADLRTSHMADLPSFPPVLPSSHDNGASQNTELTMPNSDIIVVRTRTPGVTGDEFHLSKSVPNLMSDGKEAAEAQAQEDDVEEEVEDVTEEDDTKCYVKLVRDDAKILEDVSAYMRTKWAGLAAHKKPGKEKIIVKKKKAQASKNKKKRFSNEDIALAATILYSSRRVYNLLRNKKILKLPHIRTVYRKLQHFQCPPGYSKQVFRLLEMKLSTLKEKDRVVGISFDEMHLEQKYSWSPLLRRLFGKHKV